MHSYQNLESETQKTIQDGWLRSGDLGTMDENGFLSLTGRKKEIIITSWGVNVAPTPLEQKLKRSPFIKDVAVIGNGRPFIAALIVPNRERIADRVGFDPGNEATIREHGDNDPVQALLRQEIDRLTSHLSPKESIKRFLLLPRDFSMERGELTTTLKLVRPVILKTFREEIEELYRAGV